MDALCAHPVDPQTRVFAYSLICVPLLRLPDEAFLEQMQSEEFASALDAIESGFLSVAMAKGISLIREYVAESRIESLDELARDRTYLFRALAPGVGAPPPCESHWCRSCFAEETMAELSDIYRQSGVDVAPSAHERADYLGVELMFMMRLIALEPDADEDELDAVRAREATFLSGHLGLWAEDYARAALLQAKTGFFKGLLQVLIALIEAESFVLRAAAA